MGNQDESPAEDLAVRDCAQWERCGTTHAHAPTGVSGDETYFVTVAESRVSGRSDFVFLISS